MELATDIDLSLEYERKCDMDTLHSLIGDMKEPDREIFIRRHYLLQSISEIALALLLDDKQIKNRL